ncbi:MAG: septum formation initiator family protein [Bacteroidales bacterium]|nr:septum formation initiator family protein [Bacteroidales bacterium]
MKGDFWQRFTLTSLAERMPSWMKNKYILTILIFLVWIILLDPNNLISRVREIQTRNRLEREKEYYIGRIEEERRKLNELRTSNETLEKYAREQYRMKKADEDLFIIVTPVEERKIRRERKVSKTEKPAVKRASDSKKR